ncbi:MAG: hypothetical protein K5886_02705 [Lachnospiraceae bacterium]|nr:hypothetical protein [Lachnospiraceae bacterium]
MQMTNEEIARSYREAKDKKKQIGILAELNLCSRTEIEYILRDEGLHPGYQRKPKEPKKSGKKKTVISEDQTKDIPGKQTKKTDAPGQQLEISMTELDTDTEEYQQELSFILDQSINPKIKRCEEKIEEISKKIQAHEKEIKALQKRTAVHKARKDKLEEIYKAIASYMG